MTKPTKRLVLWAFLSFAVLALPAAIYSQGDFDMAANTMREAIAKAAKFGRTGSDGVKDTQIAHINAREAQMLKDAGGAGTINPKTGLREYLAGGQGDSSGNNNSTGARGGNSGADHGNGAGRGGAKQGPNRDGSTVDAPTQGPNKDGSTIDANPQGRNFNSGNGGTGPKQGPNLDGSTIDANPQGIGNFNNPNAAKSEDPTSLGTFFSRLWDSIFSMPSVPSTPDEVAGDFIKVAFPGGTLAAPVGQTMGTLAQETIDGVKAGTIPGSVKDVPGMGETATVDGEGYSKGNAAADDRGYNDGTHGTGMVGGRGDGNQGLLGQIATKLVKPSALPPVVLPKPSFTSTQPDANQSLYGTPGAQFYPSQAKIT